MLQRSLADLSRLAIEHRDHLLARVQIASYNPHLGLIARASASDLRSIADAIPMA